MNILEAIDSPHVFGNLVEHGTYGGWRSFLAAMFGLPMTDDEFSLYQQCTGRTTPPTEPFREAMMPCGRRAGKSFTLALIAVYLACFTDYRPHLAPGERGTVMIMAADRKQARVIFRYCLGLIKQSPTLAKRLESETREQINLQNSITIEVVTASHKTTRGYTVVAALLDEIAFYGTEEDAASSDVEILNALRPGMGLIPNSMLLGASSPYARKGVLWDAFKRYHGEDKAPVLVWQASTRTMNPTFPQRIIDQAMAEDAASASAEYMGCFRTDVEGFVTIEAISKVTDRGVASRPYKGHRYYAFCDPSAGGSVGDDSMTLAIAHREGNDAVLDCIVEKRPPFSPEDATAEFARVLRDYRINYVTGDRFGGGFQVETFQRHGITYKLSEKNRSQIYLDVMPLIMSGRVKLLDNPRMAEQFVSLERTPGRSGRDVIDHPKGRKYHDDVCNAASGALTLVSAPSVAPARSINISFMGR